MSAFKGGKKLTQHDQSLNKIIYDYFSVHFINCLIIAILLYISYFGSVILVNPIIFLFFFP